MSAAEQLRPTPPARAAAKSPLKLDRTVENFFADTEQMAFCTANVIPGIDFTDDPLLQGRSFSCLDTKVKRLGGPNFTKIPVNAPKGCPVSNFQQEGHMQSAHRKGRVNYEPNGWEKGRARIRWWVTSATVRR